MTAVYVYRFGAAQFDETRLELYVDGKPAALEKKPLQLLAELLRHTDEVITLDELFDVIWGGRRTIDHVLTNALAKLRKALGPEKARIITLPRVGYRFAGPVERVAVGVSLPSHFEFKAGHVVPGREHFVLDLQLSAAPFYLECDYGGESLSHWASAHAELEDSTLLTAWASCTRI